MFSWLKKHFIPHEGNEHYPHILRDINARNIVALVIFLEIFTFLIPIFTHLNKTDNMAAVLPAVLTSLTNDERQAQNLKILTINPTLNKAAELKAIDMATYGYFAHVSPNGKTPWYWIEAVGYKYQYAGENLAVNFNDSKDVTGAWMASPTHKANIVKGYYTEIGTGVASGFYEGKEAIFVAQVYANPLPKIVKQSKPSQIENKPTKKIPKIVTITEKKSADVLGAEVAIPDEEKESGVVASDTPTGEAFFWQKLLISPRSTTNTILYIVFGIIFISLFLYIFIKTKNHHQGPIINALFILVVVSGIFIANYYLSHRGMLTADSFDYELRTDGNLE